MKANFERIERIFVTAIFVAVIYVLGHMVIDIRRMKANERNMQRIQFLDQVIEEGERLQRIHYSEERSEKLSFLSEEKDRLLGIPQSPKPTSMVGDGSVEDANRFVNCWEILFAAEAKRLGISQEEMFRQAFANTTNCTSFEPITRGLRKSSNTN